MEGTVHPTPLSVTGRVPVNLQDVKISLYNHIVRLQESTMSPPFITISSRLAEREDQNLLSLPFLNLKIYEVEHRSRTVFGKLLTLLTWRADRGRRERETDL